MPEVVNFFAEHKDYREVRRLQNEILSQYEDDFGKHAGSAELARIRMVWNSIPMQLAKENKKFFFGQIKKGALTEQYVLQELVSGTHYTPYYFGTDSQNFEMDFMIQKGRDAVPIEVKAETNTQAKSLKAYHKKYEPRYAVRVSMLDYIEQDYLTNIPLYAACNI